MQDNQGAIKIYSCDREMSSHNASYFIYISHEHYCSSRNLEEYTERSLVFTLLDTLFFTVLWKKEHLSLSYYRRTFHHSGITEQKFYYVSIDYMKVAPYRILRVFSTLSDSMSTSCLKDNKALSFTY